MAGGITRFFFDIADCQATAGDAYIYLLTSLVRGSAQSNLSGEWSELAKQGIVNYVYQYYLGSTALVTSDNGTQVAITKYYPY